ncbi:unnamed protein product [Coregonus sp. 'balchen']|nr:unnamed protein product [Coregonus sp. 'balchen']
MPRTSWRGGTSVRKRSTELWRCRTTWASPGTQASSTDPEEREEEQEYDEEASEVHGHDGLDQRCDLTPADPLLNSTGHSSRMVTPETDSGFGSSDLSRPATGLSQPKLDTERSRLQFQCDGTASPVSDSEGSCSSVMGPPVLLLLQCDGTASPVSMSDSEGSCSNLQTTVHAAGDIGERRPSLQMPL